MPQDQASITPAQYGQNDILALMQAMDKQQVPIQDQINHLAVINPNYGKMDAGTYSQFRKEVGLPLQGLMTTPSSLKDKIIEGVRPYADVVAGGVSGAAAAPTGPLGVGAAGLGGAMIIDQALQAAEDRKPVSALTGSTGMANTVETVGLNELGGRIGDTILGKMGNVLQELKTPGSVVGSIANLHPTYSQYLQKTFNSSTMSKWVEDIFASGSKAASMERSGQLAMTEGLNLAKGITNRTSAVMNKDWMAPVMQQELSNNFYASLNRSNDLANTAKLIAKANPIQLPITGTTVEGPINLTSSVKLAQDFLDQNTKVYGSLSKGPPEKQHLISAAQELIRVAQPVTDPQTGQIIRVTPVSFNDAWTLKQGADELGYGDPRTNVSMTSSTFKKISQALNDDIDRSIPAWTNNPNNAATKAWQSAKATVSARNNLFNQDGVRQLINETNSAVPDIDKILADPVQLQRALNAGELKLPNVDANGNTSITLHSTNLRRDLQGYKLGTMLQSAWEGDPINPDVGRIDAQKLSNAWQTFGEGDAKNLLFAKNSLFSQQNRSDIDQFIKNVGKVQQKQLFSGMGSKNMWMIRGGVMLAPALVGSMTGLSEYGAGISGVMLGGSALANLMVKGKILGAGSESIPRLMVALSSDAPVGRSMETISKSIVGALQGTGAVITLNTRDGKKIAGTIDKSGQFVPQQ